MSYGAYDYVDFSAYLPSTPVKVPVPVSQLVKNSIKDTISSVVGDTIDVIKQGIDYYKEGKRLENKKYELHKDLIRNSEENKKKYYNELYSSFKSENFCKNDLKNYLSGIENYDDKINFVHMLINFDYSMEKLWKIISTFTEMQKYVEVNFDKYINFYNDLTNNEIKFHDAEKTFKKLNNLIEKGSEELIKLKEEKINNAVLPEEIYIDNVHNTELPIKLYFKNNLYDNLYKEKEEFNDINIFDSILNDLQNKLKEINGLQILGDDYIEVKKMYDSAIEIINDESLSDEDKISMSKFRYELISDDYKKFAFKYKDILKIKNEFDSDYDKYVLYCDALNLQPKQFDIQFDNIKELISYLKETNKTLIEKYNIINFMNKSKEQIRKYLIQLGYSSIGYTTLKNEYVEIYREYFAIGNGNVLEVNIGSNYTINYKVVGVKVQGLNIDKINIKNSMNKVCPKMKELNKILGLEENCSVTKIYGAEESPYKEIELPYYIPQHYKNKIQQERREIIESASKKYLEIDEG